MVRRFSHHGEDRSRNLCRFTSNPNSQDPGRGAERAQPWAEKVYRSYVAFCATVGATPQAFENWRTDDYGVTLADIEERIKRANFHGYDPVKSVDADFFHPIHSSGMRGYYEPPRRPWNGGWDNAVQLVEEAR